MKQKESEVVSFLLKNWNTPRSISSIAKFVKLSENETNKILKKFAKQKVLVVEKKGNKNYYRIGLECRIPTI